MLSKRNWILKNYFQRIFGISYIYKLFFTEENIAQREDVTVKSVTCAGNFTQIERNQLFVQRLNNFLLILLCQQKGLFLARNILINQIQ